MKVLYFECHVTIDPVLTSNRLLDFESICTRRRFRPAKLLMQKRAEATLERSDKDSFCTGHSQNEDELRARMVTLINDLKEAGFKVWRYKIEAITLDSRMNDIYDLLDRKDPHAKPAS